MTTVYDPAIFAHALAIIMPGAIMLGMACPRDEDNPAFTTRLRALVSMIGIGFVTVLFCTGLWTAMDASFDDLEATRRAAVCAS